jgi:phosphohistidine swiveling domain-containing protein
LAIAKQYRDNGHDISKLEKSLTDYLFEYDHQGTKYGYGQVWDRASVIERVKYLGALSDLDQKISHLDELPAQQTSAVEKCLAEIHADQKLTDLVETTRTYVFLRTYRTDILSAVVANSFNLFSEIGRRNALELLDVLESLPNEILSFKFPAKEAIRERAKSSIVRGMEGAIYYLTGDKAKTLSDSILQQNQPAVQQSVAQPTEAREIKGNIANQGSVKGKVKIILASNQLDKVKPGDVLVAVMTTPDFVPAMEKASAFVTDEGGILCHAAIVSREMGKPCIIGTKIATQVLKDGDEVEVDADKGVVTILKRAL